MGSLLDWLQPDKEKQPALQSGILDMGLAMMAGGKQDFGTSLAQGIGAGVKTYQQKFEEARKKALAMAPYKAAMTPAKPAVPAVYNVGGRSLPQLGDAQEVAQNMYNLPQAANPYKPPEQDMTGEALGMPASLMPQGMGVEDLSGGQAAPIEEVAAQPARAASFNQAAFRDAILQDPSHPAYQKLVESMVDQKEIKPQLVTRYVNGKPIQEWLRPGEAEGVRIGEGKPDGDSYKERTISPDGRTYIKQSSLDGGRTWQQIEGSKPYDIRAASGSSNTNVSVGGATIVNAAQKEAGKGLGDYAIKLRESANNAYGAADEVNYVVDSLKGYGGGPLTAAKAWAGRFAPNTEWGKIASVGELAKTVQAKLAPTLRVAGSGATTDFEMKLWMSAIPTLATTETGRGLMKKYTNRVAERAAYRAEIEAEAVNSGDLSVANINRKMKARFGDKFLDPQDEALIKGKPKGVNDLPKKPGQIKFLGFEE